MVIQKLDGKLLKNAIIHGAVVLKNNKNLVDSLNVFPVPDGDTGTNMSLTMDQATEELKRLSSDDLKKVADAAAWGSLMGARGNSGVILSQLFRGFAQGISSKKRSLSAVDLAMAYKTGVDAAYRAVMRPVEGTILTVARETSERMLAEAKHTKDISVLLEKIVDYGEKVLEKTPEMLPVLKEARVVDAGGKGLVFIMKGFLDVIRDPQIRLHSDTYEIEQPSQASNTSIIETDTKIDKIYCTELFVRGRNIDIEGFKIKLQELGDSLVVVGTDDLVKIHVHTNHPGQVLETAIVHGELSKVKIDNMKLQHQTLVDKPSEEDMRNVDDKYDVNGHNITQQGHINTQQHKDISIIAVSQGDGLNAIFRSMGAYVIEGGQTMNPSTENILSAIKEHESKHTIILPNNKNIILTAEQVKNLSNRDIHVIPTKTIPQGIAALLSFNPEISIEQNVSNMSESIKSVVTGEVTYAVRDSAWNGTKIKQGDILGIQDGKLLYVGKAPKKVMDDLVSNMVKDRDGGIITIYYGSEVESSIAEHTADTLMKSYKNFDVEFYDGGQSLYYYIISVE
ncbi:MAG: DAK2 domain-containing protein [Tepidanaerobacteraceae bacterium]